METLQKDCPTAVPHAMNVWAQYLDWNMTGKVGNPEVAEWLTSAKKGLVWTMFEKAGDLAMIKFFLEGHSGHHFDHVIYHDLECDETPNGGQCTFANGSSCHQKEAAPGCECFDNAHCEMAQLLFDIGYARVFPHVFAPSHPVDNPHKNYEGGI